MKTVNSIKAGTLFSFYENNEPFIYLGPIESYKNRNVKHKGIPVNFKTLWITEIQDNGFDKAYYGTNSVVLFSFVDNLTFIVSNDTMNLLQIDKKKIFIL